MNKKLITIALLAVFSVSAQAGDIYYKWVDERGITHYSQNPPDDNGKSKVQVINVSTRIPMGSEEAIGRLEKQRSDAVKKDEDSREGVRKTGAKSAATPNVKDKARCDLLKADAQTLNDKAGRIKVTNEKGEVHTMTEDERIKRMEDTQKDMKIYCD